jgi:hypothetical protein
MQDVERQGHQTGLVPRPSMSNRFYLARQIVEVLGGHLVFLDAERRLAAVFLLDLVESWEVLPRLDGRP